METASNREISIQHAAQIEGSHRTINKLFNAN